MLHYIFTSILVPILIASISASIIGPIAAKKTLESSKKIEISYVQCEEITTSLWRLEFLLSKLMEKYDISAEKASELSLKISDDERNEINRFILEVNIALGKLFFVMDDKHYVTIMNSIPLEPKKLKEIREDLMLAMRKIINPKTNLTKKEIRFLYELVKH